MKAKWLITSVTVAFALFLAYVIFCAITRQDVFFLRFIRSIPYGDKLGHLCLIGTMAFLLDVSLIVWRKPKTIRSNILLGSSIMFVIVTLEEFTQIFLPTRTFDLVDLSANYLGILLFGGIAFLLGKGIRSRLLSL